MSKYLNQKQVEALLAKGNTVRNAEYYNLFPDDIDKFDAYNIAVTNEFLLIEKLVGFGVKFESWDLYKAEILKHSSDPEIGCRLLEAKQISMAEFVDMLENQDIDFSDIVGKNSNKLDYSLKSIKYIDNYIKKNKINITNMSNINFSLKLFLYLLKNNGHILIYTNSNDRRCCSVALS